MRRNYYTATTNDVNGSLSLRMGSAPGRVGGKADSVVIQRNPYNPHATRFKSKKPFRVGTWNVRTLLETGAATILASELAKAKIKMMALQEVRWPDSGETTCGSYTFLWSGPTTGAPRSAGVALALDSSAIAAMISWHPISDRLLTARFKHNFGYLSIVVAYAPTNDANDDDKDTFYQQMEQVMKMTHHSDLIVCLGDFNAVTGNARTNMEHVIGPYGSGSPNDNTERLLDFCVGAGLRVSGSWFKRKDIHRYTWFSNDGTTIKEIDHILVNTKWSALRNCRVYRSLEFDTDHRPVIATLSLRLKRTTKEKSLMSRYDTKKLADPALQLQYAVEITNRFAALTPGEASNWDKFKETLNDAATKHLGLCKQTRKPWVSDTTLSLVEKKRQARLLDKRDEYKTLNTQCKANLKQDRQRWADNLAAEGEAALMAGETRDAFANFRRLAKATRPVCSPILDANGNLISHKSQKLECWKKYYAGLLDRPSTPMSEELSEAAQSAIEDTTINTSEPTKKEVIDCLNRMKRGKAPGICNITPEMLKAGGSECGIWLTNIYQNVWRSGVIPSDWKKGIILPFYKGKGNRQECKNYRGITLLSCPGKLFARILLSRVKNLLLTKRRNEQSGYTPGRSTVDRIFTLQTLLQTRREYNRSLWIAYVDLKAAFDSIDRNALWLVLTSLGVPKKIVDLMRELYTDTFSCVRVDGQLSNWFPVTSGVRQGCTIAPDLFLAPMDWLLQRTVHQGLVGATLSHEVFTDLDFADDVALLAETVGSLLLALEIMQQEARPLGLEINWPKTKIQVTGTEPTNLDDLSVLGQNVEVVDSFTYLGCTIHNTGSSAPEITRRIAIARNCMKTLDKSIWRTSITLKTKIRLYNSYILPVLLYGAETWTITGSIEKKLDAFDMWCLRRILRIPYTRHTTNREVRERTGQPEISSSIRSRRLRQFGHIARGNPRADHTRALQACMNGPPRGWKRPVGRPRHTWLRTVEDDLRPLNLGPFSAWKTAQNRQKWRSLVEKATSPGIRYR